MKWSDEQQRERRAVPLAVRRFATVAAAAVLVLPLTVAGKWLLAGMPPLRSFAAFMCGAVAGVVAQVARTHWQHDSYLAYLDAQRAKKEQP